MAAPMTRATGLCRRIADGLFALALLAGAAMMTHVTVDVLARSLLARPLPGTNEVVAAYYMIAVAFLPWAHLALADRHITVDMFVARLGRRWRAGLDLFARLVTILYMAVFTWQSWIGALRRTARGEVLEIPTGFLPAWPGRWLLPVAGAAMLVALVLRLVADLGTASRDGGDGDGSGGRG